MFSQHFVIFTSCKFLDIPMNFDWDDDSLQSFAIPGPIFLSILSGALFGGVPGFLLVCLVQRELNIFCNIIRFQCATFGASACYGLSYTFGRGIVAHFFPNQLVNFKKKVAHFFNLYAQIHFRGFGQHSQFVLVHAIPPYHPFGSELVREHLFSDRWDSFFILFLRNSIWYAIKKRKEETQEFCDLFDKV